LQRLWTDFSKTWDDSVAVSESEWVVAPNAFVAIIDAATSQKAQQLPFGRTINKSNDELLEALRSLLRKEGRLSLRLIRDSPDTASLSAYRGRFGSIRSAYALIGYGQPKDFGPIDLRRRTQALRDELIDHIQAIFPGEVSIKRRGGRWRSCLRLKNGVTVSVIVARATLTKKKGLVWRIDPIARERQHIALLALLDGNNGIVKEMFLFPYIDKEKRFHVTANNVWLKNGLPVTRPSQLPEALRTISGGGK
jgi:hypothetical protein